VLNVQQVPPATQPVQETTPQPSAQMYSQPAMQQPVYQHPVTQPNNIPQQNINVIQPQAGNPAAGFQSRPAQIYVEPGATPAPEMKMVFKEEEENSNVNTPPAPPEVPMQQALEDLEEQKRKQAERVAKLRSISFNVKNMENNAELENVPAYLRRNINLENGAGSAEQFYSNYTVGDQGQNFHPEINTINTFLDGKKPD
jgi:cell division protein FtsZ